MTIATEPADIPQRLTQHTNDSRLTAIWYQPPSNVGSWQSSAIQRFLPKSVDMAAATPSRQLSVPGSK